jgi:hypothetical protein
MSSFKTLLDHLSALYVFEYNAQNKKTNEEGEGDEETSVFNIKGGS